MKRKAYDGVYNRYIKRGIDFCLALIGFGYCSNSDGNRCNRY